MQSKTSFFNKGIFLNNIKRFWLITFSYSFFLLIFIVGYLNSETQRMMSSVSLETLQNIGRNIFNRSSDVMLLFHGFYSLVTALAVFSYMHFTKNTAMIHSLPVKRDTLFFTNYLSGLFIVTLPLLFNGLILIIAETALGFRNINYAWIWLGANLVLAFLLYTFGVFAGMFTGHMAAQAIFFYIFNFLAVFLEYMIEGILHDFLFGFTSSSSTSFVAWSPLYNINTFFSAFGNGKGNISTLIGYLIAGILFLFSSLLLYRKRNMEVATDIISLQCVKPIFKYSVSFCSSVLLGGIMVSMFNIRQELVPYIITYLIGGFIGYFSAEMLLRKTFRVFKAYKGFVAFGIALTLFLCSIGFDFFGYERRVPPSSDVELMYVSRYSDQITELALSPESYDPDRHRWVFDDNSKNFSENAPQTLTDEHLKMIKGYPGVVEDAEAIIRAGKIHAYIVENEDILRDNIRGYRVETVSVDRKPPAYPQNRNLYFGYRLKDGSIVERSYSIRLNEENKEFDQLIRDYFGLPVVTNKYVPLLEKTTGDIRSVTIHFTTLDGQYRSDDVENIDGLLSAYKKDLQARDPLEIMFPRDYERLYDINVSIEYKDYKLRNSYTSSPSSLLHPGFKNTLDFLVENSMINLDDLQKSEYMMKYDPAAIFVD